MIDIQLTDITTGTVDGTGVFDKLMNAVKEHIKEEYENGRIKGPDYAQVYLGALQGVLGQSVEFVLREKLTEVQVDLTIAQKDELLLNGVKDRELKDSQIVGSGYDNQVKAEQVLMSTFERTELQPKQLEKLEEDVKLVYVTRVGKDKEVAGMGLDLVIKGNNAAPPSVYTPKYEV